MGIKNVVEKAFTQNIVERETDYLAFNEEFDHLEGDTIVGVHHKSDVITLVERLSEIIITLKPDGRKASDIEQSMNQWLALIPRLFFKSLTFACGKEFFNWKALNNQHDIAIYFADPGTPSQRAMNEKSKGFITQRWILIKQTKTLSLRLHTN